MLQKTFKRSSSEDVNFAKSFISGRSICLLNWRKVFATSDAPIFFWIRIMIIIWHGGNRTDNLSTYDGCQNKWILNKLILTGVEEARLLLPILPSASSPWLINARLPGREHSWPFFCCWIKMMILFKKARVYIQIFSPSVMTWSYLFAYSKVIVNCLW